MNRLTWGAVAAAIVLTIAILIARMPTAEPRAGESRKVPPLARREPIEKTLNFSDAQKEQWKAIQQRSLEQNAEFFRQVRQTTKEFRAAIEAGDPDTASALMPLRDLQNRRKMEIRDANQQQLLAILTVEQREKYAVMRAEREKRRAEELKQQQSKGR